MRSPDTSKPLFHARDEAERQEMRAYLFCRLYQDDGLDDDRDLSLIPGIDIDAYALAKIEARRGNLQPFAKILSKVMNDPAIADFLAVPRRGRGRRSSPYKQYFHEGVIDTVQKIRAIWRQDYGLTKRDRAFDDSAEKIAGEIYGLGERTVLQLMKKAR